MSDPPTSGDDLGPVDYLAVEFPAGQISSSGFEVLLDLADRGVLRILDLEFIAKDDQGTARSVALSDLTLPDGVDLTAWDGASSGLLDGDDIAEVGSALAAGSVAAVVVFENQWVIDLVDTWRAAGARLIGDGGVPVDDLVAALDSTEPD